MSDNGLCKLCQDKPAINVGLEVESLLESASRKLLQVLFKSYKIHVSILEETSSICKKCYECILQISKCLEKWSKVQEVLKANPLDIDDSMAFQDDSLETDDDGKPIKEEERTTEDLSYLEDEDESNAFDMELIEGGILNSQETRNNTAPPPSKKCRQIPDINMLGEMQKSVDRINSEMASLRSEVETIKVKVFGGIIHSKIYLPPEPFTCMDKFKSFELSLKDSKKFETFVQDLLKCSEKSFEKFIRSCWRDVLSDEVARQFSWRGTESKLCVRGLHVTAAVRAAFKQRFALSDSDFDRITQKYFQYANDRYKRVKT